MVNAVILLQVDKSKVNEVALKLVELSGVSEVYSVAGHFDLVVIVRVRENDQIAEAVTNHMLQIDGIQRSETLIAFRAFSRHDLEAMFSVGMEEPLG